MKVDTNKIKKNMPQVLQGFKNFILRGNAVDLAVGVVIGASFNNLITAIVKDLLTPTISAVARVPDFSGSNFVLNGYTISYGNFLNNLISFFLVAVAIYFLVILPMNTLSERVNRLRPRKPTHKACPECLSEIPIGAKRCAHCGQVVSQ